jgi:hypothetical protein
MRTLLFVEIKGKKHFKCDTFWSKSTKVKDAKVYSEDSIDGLKKLLHPVISGFYKSDNETIEQAMEKFKTWVAQYEDAKLGYFRVNDGMLKDTYSMKDVEVEYLGPPIYLWTTSIRDSSGWKMKVQDYPALDMETVADFIDYKQFHRDELIGDILKKESE